MKKTSYNDFEFLRILGKGAFSTVYLVQRKLDKQNYALKCMTMKKLKEKQQKNSVNEVRILSSISHPNIVGYKEAFWNQKNNTLNIVMEYCDDGDLETKINNMKRNEEKFDEKLIWEYSIQIIQGLKALHDKKIIHRDLKSANIFLIKGKNICKIGDLNLGKVLKKNKLINEPMGTPRYASPEVMKKEPFSYKSDIWSVGCIIYEMCKLRTPFLGKTMDELTKQICSGKFERISRRYSNDLWNFINRMLVVDVNKRADCDELLNSDIIKKLVKDMSRIDLLVIANEEDSSIMETIEYQTLRELQNKIPNKVKYINKNRNKNNNNNNDDDLEDTIINESSYFECSCYENNNKNSKQKIVGNNNTINTTKINYKNIFLQIKTIFKSNDKPHNKPKFPSSTNINKKFYLSNSLQLKVNKSQNFKKAQLNIISQNNNIQTKKGGTTFSKKELLIKKVAKCGLIKPKGKIIINHNILKEKGKKFQKSNKKILINDDSTSPKDNNSKFCQISNFNKLYVRRGDKKIVKPIHISYKKLSLIHKVSKTINRTDMKKIEHNKIISNSFNDIKIEPKTISKKNMLSAKKNLFHSFKIMGKLIREKKDKIERKKFIHTTVSSKDGINIKSKNDNIKNVKSFLSTQKKINYKKSFNIENISNNLSKHQNFTSIPNIIFNSMNNINI